MQCKMTLHASLCSGARVSSESWTTTAPAYDINSQNTDMFAWLFQVNTPAPKLLLHQHAVSRLMCCKVTK